MRGAVISDWIRRVAPRRKRADAVEHELTEEIRLHVELETEDLVTDGWDPVAARAEARRRLGGEARVREDVRRSRPLYWIDELRRDVVFGLRVLGRRPGFTLAVSLSLGLGIGGSTAIFSLMDAVMWRSLPVSNPAGLWTIGDAYTHREFRSLAEDPVLAGAAAYAPAHFDLAIDGETGAPVDGLLVSGDYFGLLGVRPQLGRAIGPEDDRVPGGHPIAMISDGYWRRQFGADPSVVGRSLAISGTPLTVVGITPRGFFGAEVGTSPEVFVPLMMQPELMRATSPDLVSGTQNGNFSLWLRVLGRLEEGVGPDTAFAALDTRVRASFLEQFGGVFPTMPEELIDAGDRQAAEVATFAGNMYDAMRPVLAPASRGRSELRDQVARPLVVLMGVVGILLLIACANTANLLLARAATRRREFATRLALGAGRLRLIGQLMVESVLLSAFGGILGLLLARWASEMLVRFMSKGRTPIHLELAFDLRVIAFAVATTLVTGILFGLMPALRATGTNVGLHLKSVRIQDVFGYRLRVDRLLAISQIALSMVLLIAAGLFMRSLAGLDRRDSGFDRGRVLIARIFLENWNDEGRPERLEHTYTQLFDRIGAIPGVASTSIAEFTPTERSGRTRPITTGDGREVEVDTFNVSPGYFQTVGILLVEGRDFTPDDRMTLEELLNAPREVYVVNETYAREFFPNSSPVGRSCVSPRFIGRSCTIVGVVRDSAYADFSGDIRPTRYQPFQPAGSGSVVMALHVRTTIDPAPIVPAIRSAVSEIDPDPLLLRVRTLAEEIDAVLVRQRLLATLTGVFSGTALLLATVGLYGLFSFIVVSRRADLGIRFALGAERGAVLWMVMRDATVLILIGGLIGILSGIALARVAGSQVSGLLFGLDSVDPISIAGATVVLLIAALLAAYLPARRASHLDPSAALRSE